MVLPLRVGGGTRIKAFEAMAAGIPVVSTNIGAEGLPVKHGEHLLFADSADHFAAETVNLLRDASLREDLSANALALVSESYSWDKVVDRFEDLLQPVLRKS